MLVRPDRRVKPSAYYLRLERLFLERHSTKVKVNSLCCVSLVMRCGAPWKASFSDVILHLPYEVCGTGAVQTLSAQESSWSDFMEKSLPSLKSIWQSILCPSRWKTFVLRRCRVRFEFRWSSWLSVHLRANSYV